MIHLKATFNVLLFPFNIASAKVSIVLLLCKRYFTEIVPNSPFVKIDMLPEGEFRAKDEGEELNCKKRFFPSICAEHRETIEKKKFPFSCLIGNAHDEKGSTMRESREKAFAFDESHELQCAIKKQFNNIIVKHEVYLISYFSSASLSKSSMCNKTSFLYNCTSQTFPFSQRMSALAIKLNFSIS